MTTQAIVQLPLEKIVANPQVRQQFDREAEQGLAQSIREVGILQPLRVRHHEGQPVIVDGERRFRAARLLGLPSVPVIFEERELASAEVIQRQLVANCQREDLRPLEKARAIAHLIKTTGWTQGQIATKLGMRDAAARDMPRIDLLLDCQRGVRTGTRQIPQAAGSVCVAIGRRPAHARRSNGCT